MTRLKVSVPFLKDDDKMLWLGLLERDTGVSASEHLQIRDEVLALDFNLAVTLRLFRFDNEKDAGNKKWWRRQFGATDTDVSSETDDLLSNDPYADENTQIM